MLSSRAALALLPPHFARVSRILVPSRPGSLSFSANTDDTDDTDVENGSVLLPAGIGAGIGSAVTVSLWVKSCGNSLVVMVVP